MKLFIVVPTIRPASWKIFERKWAHTIRRHEATLVKVEDGTMPHVVVGRDAWTIADIMGKYADTIFNRADCVRNLGFAYAVKEGADIILSLDDDVEPILGVDTISDHCEVLRRNFPVSWMNTADGVYVRGFPYKIRDEAECVLSHGVWYGSLDLDAPTQLVTGGRATPLYPTGPIPKGTYFPCCAMNMAFKRKLAPYIYQAPAYGKYQRFSDIWGGIMAKREIDRRGWCAVTGFATVLHDRASDPFVNLEKEAVGIRLNEDFWKGVERDEYFKVFKEKRERWKEFCNENL